jgi:pyruvate dehydrogenase complex dehydrogenase (E1) component
LSGDAFVTQFPDVDPEETAEWLESVDAGHVVVAVLEGLARQGSVSAEAVAKAIARCDIDTEAADPRRR